MKKYLYMSMVGILVAVILLGGCHEGYAGDEWWWCRQCKANTKKELAVSEGCGMRCVQCGHTDYAYSDRKHTVCPHRQNTCICCGKSVAGAPSSVIRVCADYLHGQCVHCGAKQETCKHKNQEITKTRYSYEQIAGNDEYHWITCYNTWECKDCGEVTIKDEAWYTEEQQHSWETSGNVTMCSLCDYRISRTCRHKNTTKRYTSDGTYAVESDSLHKYVRTYDLICQDCSRTVQTNQKEQTYEYHKLDQTGSCSRCPYGSTETSTAYPALGGVTLVTTTPGKTSGTVAKAERYEIGKSVSFGGYEQDGIFGNGKEQIEWIVLDKKDDAYLLMACYGLESKVYDTSGRTGITWKTSSLRKWLNNDFLYRAFSKEELERIVTTTVVTVQSNQTKKISTQDMVFLLDSNEFYELEKKLRLAAPAERFEAEYGRICFWWLRDGLSGNGEGSLAGFLPENEVDWYTGDGYVDTLVRPCIWVRLP